MHPDTHVGASISSGWSLPSRSVRSIRLVMAASRTLQGQGGTRRRGGDETTPELEVPVSHVREGDSAALGRNVLQRKHLLRERFLHNRQTRDVPAASGSQRAGRVLARNSTGFPITFNAKHTHSAKLCPSRTSRALAFPGRTRRAAPLRCPGAPRPGRLCPLGTHCPQQLPGKETN